MKYAFKKMLKTQSGLFITMLKMLICPLKNDRIDFQVHYVDYISNFQKSRLAINLVDIPLEGPDFRVILSS